MVTIIQNREKPMPSKRPIGTRAAIAAIAAAGALGLTAVAATTGSAGAHNPWARATLRSADGTRIGTVAFHDHASGRTEVKVRLLRASGTEAFHGFHIHANDVSTNGEGCIADAAQLSSTWFVSADGHWKHDPLEIHGHHAGDLPSVFVNADGTSIQSAQVDKLNATEVVGRAVILHAGADNFANVPVGTNPDQYTAGPDALAKTQATGNAGDRVACGVITNG
jgi:superoxide dismutase, Cu-Zn family